MKRTVELLVAGAWRLVLPLLFTLSVSGANYYIDYATGSDANTGITKAAPWKKAPGMKGFAGSYSHVAGDRIILKGGVTWPANCYQWKVTWGGTTNVQDYIGSDPTWYAGASFTRPLCDFERVIINGWVLGAGLYILNASYITIDNIEFANHASPLEMNGVSTWGTATITLDGVYSSFITNSLIRNWTTPHTNGVIGYKLMGGGGIHKVNAGNATVINCEMHQLTNEVYCGTALWNITWVYGNHLHNMAGTIMSANAVRSNHIHHINNPGDPGAHSNVALLYSPIEFSGNLIHDTAPVSQVLMLGPGNDAYPAWQRIDNIFNNIVYNVTQPCVAIDTDGSNDPNVLHNVYNNTFAADICVRVGYRNNGPLAHLEAKNNLFITDGYDFLKSDPSIGGAYVTTFVDENNLTLTTAQATALGYTANNLYAPTDASDSTVGAGQNLSAKFTIDYNNQTRTAPWDIGAWEWNGEPMPAGVLVFATGAYSTAEDTSVTVTISRTGGSTGSVTVDYATTASTALAATDYTTTSGTATLANGVTSATFDVPILRNATYTGNRYLTVALSNPTGGAALGSPASAVITINDSDSAPSAVPTLGLAFPVTDMLMEAPFTVAGAIISQSIQTLNTNDSGKLSANFVVTTGGEYTLQWGVNTPGYDSDSFWLTVISTNYLCDVIPLTVGVEDRLANDRGNGTSVLPDTQPIKFNFDPGTYFMCIMGREANAGITNVSWVLRATPPPEVLPEQFLSFSGSTAWTYQNGVIIQLAVNRVGTNGTVTVDYATANDTAIAGTDYTATSGTLTFGPEITTQLISVPVANLPTYVGSKTFTVTLTNPTVAALATPTVSTVAILDDLEPPMLRIMNAGTVNVNIIVPK